MLPTTITIMLLCATCSALPLRQALEQIESGGDDRAVGRAGEVSRFQILPSVWREYSSLPRYRDAGHAWAVAQRILADRAERFQAIMRRRPTPAEIYALWNSPGQFERVGFDWSRVRRKVREKATRFENLVTQAQ